MLLSATHHYEGRFRGRLRRLLMSGAAIFAAAVMMIFAAGPAMAQPVLPSGEAICLTNYRTYCLDDYEGAPFLISTSDQGATNWYTQYEGTYVINGTTYNSYALCVDPAFTDCLTALYSGGAGGPLDLGAPATADGTAFVWSTDQNGYDLVSRYFLRTNGNYYDVCVPVLGSYIGAEMCSYATGYWRWINT
jgi:hypothetical protein